MKPSIAITLIIVIAAFSYVSGYSISEHNKRKAAYSTMAKASLNKASAPATAPAAGYGGSSPGYGGGSAPGYGGGSAAGYGGGSAPGYGGGSVPGYGSPAPGYGQ